MDQNIDQNDFGTLGLSPELLRAIADAGYTQMTGIQQKVIPLVMQGLDVIGQASTGTGKTAAFGIPAIERLISDGSTDPSVLVLCPTRELAMQVSDELRKFSKYKEGVRVVTVYGGQNIETQIRALRHSSIVVGTPGRVIDHLRRRTLKLSSVRMAVLDEADEMLDMGFLGDIKQILFNTPKERQTLLFSATMPKEILRVTQQFQRNPEHVKGDDGQVAFDLIEQYYCEVPRSKKAQAVRLVFEQYGATRGLVFCNTKIMVDKLVRALTDLGVAASGLHGDMRQSARTQVMSGFKDGSINMLVATDVAARGIDASGVDIIINYDIPQDIEYYVHRIGRTGRAGNQGVAFTLIAGHGELFGLRDIEDATGQRLKPYYLQKLEETPEDKVYARNTAKNDSGAYRSSVPRRGGPEDKPRRGGANAVISVDVGRNHDITERQIVNAIVKYARIKKEDIGQITLRDDDAHIELSPDVARHVIKSTADDATVNDFVVEFKMVSEGSKPPSSPSNRQNDRPGRKVNFRRRK